MNPIVEAILGVVSGPLDKLLGRFFANADDKQKAMLEIQAEIKKSIDSIVQAAMAAQQAQIDVNKTEAASSSVFVAGWRPAIGWVCGFALAWQFVLQPFATWILSVVCLYQKLNLPPLPTLDTGPLMTVMLGMLGLTAARTVEAIQGVSRNTLEEKRTP